MGRVRGFSLIEVLVAFTILALSLGVLYKSAGGSSIAVRTAAESDRALLWARSLMGRWPSEGIVGWDESGTTEDGFRWNVQSRALPDPQGLTRRWSLYEVEVVVSWGNTRHPRSVRLYSVLPQVLANSAPKAS